MAKIDFKAATGALSLTITAALGAVYAVEGGYADDPHDRGGRTMYGVTEKVMRQFGYQGEPRDFPKHCDAKHPVCADLVYTVNYIDRPGYRPMAAIAPAVLFELVDSAVLHGPLRSSYWFQKSLNAICHSGLKADGVVGPATINAYRACQPRYGPEMTCRFILDGMDGQQAQFFHTIVANDPSQRKFLKGWLRQRVGNVDRAKCKP